MLKSCESIQRIAKESHPALARRGLACIIKMLKCSLSRRESSCPALRQGRETVGENGKIQCQKAVYGAGCSGHDPDPGLCGGHKDGYELAAQREHTVSDGGHRVSWCKPGARGERGLGCAAELAHSAGRVQDHRNIGRKLQPAADGVYRGYGYEQRAGQGVQQAGSGQKRPAQHLPNPLYH